MTPGNGIAVQWRSAEAGQSDQVLAPAGGGAPVWVIASRYTDAAPGLVYYSAYISTDGVNFSYVPGSPWCSACRAAGGRHRVRLLQLDPVSTATVDNLASLPGSQPPPFICPDSWSCTDIGGAPAGQDQLSSAGTWNESGGGGDIWGTADSFHFVSQTLSADGTVTAHVTAQQATDPWAKAGPMVRATTDPGSPYYAVFVTPGNGVAVQWRSTQGGRATRWSTRHVPAYLMVARYTTSGGNPQTFYTAYSSPDGVTWAPIPGSTLAIAMTGPLLAGFAITSHNQGAAGAVTLD